MAYSYDGAFTYDFDHAAVAFRVVNDDQVETWRITDEALEDAFGSASHIEVLKASFVANAAAIVGAGNSVRPRRSADLVLTAADFREAK